MSSGFVSGGTADNPIERDDEWLKAQQELEATRRRKDEESRQEGGKSLYEVLQQNKATKQDAFEESIRLKNQFRNLDEDEVEFLDSVLESTRAKEEAIKRETREQLDIFRRQQEEADRMLALESPDGGDTIQAAGAGSPTSEESQWAINARKRKRVKEKEVLKGVKLRKSSSSAGVQSSVTGDTSGGSLAIIHRPDEKRSTIVSQLKKVPETKISSSTTKTNFKDTEKATPGAPIQAVQGRSKEKNTNGALRLGLGSYGSEEDD